MYIRVVGNGSPADDGRAGTLVQHNAQSGVALLWDKQPSQYVGEGHHQGCRGRRRFDGGS